MKTLSIQVPDELYERAARRAAAQGTSLERALVALVEQLGVEEESAVDVPVGPPEEEAHLDRVYEIMSRRYRSGHHDTAERHNEHQP